MQIQLAALCRRDAFANRLIAKRRLAIKPVDGDQENSQPKDRCDRSHWLLLQLFTTQPQLRGSRSMRLARIPVNRYLGVQRKGEHQDTRNQQQRAPAHGIHGPVRWHQGRHIHVDYTCQPVFRAQLAGLANHYEPGDCECPCSLRQSFMVIAWGKKAGGLLTRRHVSLTTWYFRKSISPILRWDRYGSRSSSRHRQLCSSSARTRPHSTTAPSRSWRGSCHGSSPRGSKRRQLRLPAGRSPHGRSPTTGPRYACCAGRHSRWSEHWYDTPNTLRFCPCVPAAQRYRRCRWVAAWGTHCAVSRGSRSNRPCRDPRCNDTNSFPSPGHSDWWRRSCRSFAARYPAW